MVVTMFYLKALIDAILPPRCAFTGNLVDSQGMIAAEAWGTLSFISQPNCHNCGVPFDFAPHGPLSGGRDGGIDGTEDKMRCAACLADPPEFSRARSAIAYDDASRDFILAFKHGDKTEHVVTMLPWLKTAGADLWADADVVVPVPLHRWRLWQRRYNQAALIGAAVARMMGKDFIVDALERTRATPTQGHLKADERRKNVKSAFSVHPKRQEVIRGKTILLVDDVYTTGSTVRECARVLLAAGVKDVFVLTLARVVRPSRFD